MKNKIIKLVEQGFSVQTLSKMNESQVDALYKRLISEKKKEAKEAVITTQKSGFETQVTPGSEASLTVGDVTIKTNPDKGLEIQSKSKPSGTGETKESVEKSKKGKKGKSKNPWAICTATMGKEFGTSERSDWSKSQMKKYEKCVMGVKKSIKEGVDPYEYILEEKIMEILESSLNPKMTKRDFLNTVYSKSVMEAEEAPVKAPPKPKTPVKPGKPDTPFKPKHKPKPKAEKSDIPSWFTWDELGINLK